MKTVARISFLLLSLALVVFSVCFLMAIFHSTQSLTATEIKPIEESLQKITEVLRQEGAPNGLIAKLKNDTARLQGNLKIITESANSAPEMRKQTTDDLNNIVLSLNMLQTEWSKRTPTITLLLQRRFRN